jgi:hypothetical protein
MSLLAPGPDPRNARAEQASAVSTVALAVGQDVLPSHAFAPFEEQEMEVAMKRSTVRSVLLCATTIAVALVLAPSLAIAAPNDVVDCGGLNSICQECCCPPGSTMDSWWRNHENQ